MLCGVCLSFSRAGGCQASILDEFGPPCVIDFGSSRTRAGHAVRDSAGMKQQPPIVFPSVIGRPRGVDGTQASGTTVVGGDVMLRRAGLEVTHPIANGRIQDWAGLELLWNHALRQVGSLWSSTSAKAGHGLPPVCVVLPPDVSPADRDRLAQLAFEALQLPAICFVDSISASLASVGAETGVVVDVGSQRTLAGVVYCGSLLRHSVRALPAGGEAVTSELMRLLSSRLLTLNGAAGFEALDAMKRRLGFVKESGNAAPQSSSERLFELPDGSVLNVQDELWQASEAQVPLSLASTVLESLSTCCAEVVLVALQHVHCCGGGSLLSGYPKRLQSDLAMLPVSRGGDLTRVSVQQLGVSELCEHAAWVGGAVLATAPSRQALWVTSQEYAEVGLTAVRMKHPL